MKHTFTPVASLCLMVAASLGLGIAMPSCPGQQEMDQKFEALENSNKELNKKVQALSSQIQTMNNDMTQVKTLLPQITNVLSGQKGQIDKLDADVRAVQTKLASKKKK